MYRYLLTPCVVLATLLGCLFPAGAIILVKDGQPAATIVLPAQTEFDKYAGDKKAFTDEEKLAAQELQSILEKISGAKLPIATADAKPRGTLILLGAEQARAQGLGAQIDKLDKDGLICTVKGENLILTGQRARGALYAVYTFLESLGCRWTMPGPAGELYPTLKTVETKINVTQNPSHSQRYWWCTYGDAPGYAQWTLRNKGNYIRTIGDQYIQQNHALSQALIWGAHQDKYRLKGATDKVTVKKKDANGNMVDQVEEREKFILPDDYYARESGKPNFGVPNMSNPKVIDLYVDYDINNFKTHPGLQYMSISAEDGFVNDEHPETRKLDSNEFDNFIGAPTATDRLLNFHNRVIARVVKEVPYAKFGMIVYSNNTTPPRLEQVNSHMALVFAPLTICPLHNIRDPKCKTNRSYCQWFEDWMVQAKGAGAETYYYDYEPMGYCWNMAMICPRWGIIGKNYPWFHQQGLNGHTTQGYDDWASCGLDNYLMERLYWNVDEDYHAIIADYSKARFGAAAQAMIDYYNILEKRMDEIPDLYQNEVWANHLILTPDVRKRCDAKISQAVKLADTPRAKEQVQMMADLQTSTNAMCDAMEYADATGDFGKAAKMMEPCFAMRDKLNKYYPKFMNPTRLNEKETAEFMTGGLYNQYKKIDAKIAGAAAKVLLPRTWKGMLDTRNHATPLGYYKPEVSVKELDDLDICLCPDVKYGTEREVSAFFYRSETDVPRSFAGKQKITLYFPGLIAKGLQVWVNGQPVTFDVNGEQSTIWRGPSYFWMNYDHQNEYDITPFVKPGQKNTIAFRVFKSYDFAGSYRRPYLLAN